jgi:transcriptional regulator with XRE-family HTH domain
MSHSAEERDAFVQAEVATALAHQIRALRIQRGWSQAELAQRLGTKQHAVSRLEDPSYGRCSLQTLFLLSKAFDVGLKVGFVSFVSMLKDSFKPSHAERCVPSFEEEASTVGFYTQLPTDKGLTHVSSVWLAKPGHAMPAASLYQPVIRAPLDGYVWRQLNTQEIAS